MFIIIMVNQQVEGMCEVATAFIVNSTSLNLDQYPLYGIKCEFKQGLIPLFCFRILVKKLHPWVFMWCDNIVAFFISNQYSSIPLQSS